MVDIGGLPFKVVQHIHPHVLLKFRLDHTNSVGFMAILI